MRKTSSNTGIHIHLQHVCVPVCNVFQSVANMVPATGGPQRTTVWLQSFSCCGGLIGHTLHMGLSRFHHCTWNGSVAINPGSSAWGIHFLMRSPRATNVGRCRCVGQHITCSKRSWKRSNTMAQPQILPSEIRLWLAGLLHVKSWWFSRLVHWFLEI